MIAYCFTEKKVIQNLEDILEMDQCNMVHLFIVDLNLLGLLKRIKCWTGGDWMEY